MPPNQDQISNGKQIDNIHAHNCFVFYSCKMLRNELAQMPLLGNVAEFKKFLCFHQDPTKETSSNEQIRVHLHTVMKIACGSFQRSGDEVVVLFTFFVTDDLAPNGRHLRVQHTSGTATSPPS